MQLRGPAHNNCYHQYRSTHSHHHHHQHHPHHHHDDDHQGAWEPVNVDAAARTSAQEIEIGTGEEKELFLASQVFKNNF